ANNSAATLSCRGLSHMCASQDLYAKLGKGNADFLRRHRHQAVAGHARRSVHFEERPGTIVPEDQVDTTPAGAADDVECPERLSADRVLGRLGQSARTVIARLVRKIFVVIMVVALRRLDANKRQR